MPKDDLAPREGRGIIPASWRVVGPDAQTPGSVDVIADAADTINAFVYRARQAAFQSVISQHRAQLAGPNVDIEYHRNQGEERITLRPYVTTAQPEAVDEPAVAQPTIEQPAVDYPKRDLYLLVLYKKSHYAIFPMSSLGAGTDGKASASITASADLVKEGADFGTQNIYVNQLTVGSLSVILSGADLTGKSKGDMLCLCTTQLTDTLETKIPNTTIPFMNGQGNKTNVTIYTQLSSYTYTTSTPPTFTPDATGRATYAYAPDGTSYYTDGFTGTPGLTINGAVGAEVSIPPFKSETAIETGAVFYIYSTAKNDSDTSKLIVDDFGTYDEITPYLYGYDNRSYRIVDTGDQIVTSTLHLGGAPISDTPKNISVPTGSTYLAEGPYGATPELVSYKTAYTTSLYNVYDGATNATTQMLGSQEQDDISGTLPRPVYDQKSNSVTVALDSVSANTHANHSVVQHPPLYPDENYPRQPDISISGDDGTSDNKTIPWPDTFNGHETISNSSGSGLTVYGVPGTTAGEALYNLTSLDAVLGGVEGLLTITGATFTQTQGQTGYERTVKVVGTGFLATPTTTTTIEPGTSLSNGVDLASHYPGNGGATDTITYSGSLTWHGVTINDQTSIVVYPFPLSVSKPYGGNDETCFYTTQKFTKLMGGGEDGINLNISLPDGPADTHTPYGKYSDDFTPWLHIANAEHLIQGFAIGTGDTLKNYLFLDGGDFMPYLTKTLDCKENDIVAAYMDVPLSAVQGLRKITSTSLTADENP